jgi:hypothetical protein
MTTKPVSSTAETKMHWVHVDDLDASEPATPIDLSSVLHFRNGLGKLCASRDLKPGTLSATLAYRAMLDLDHLARLLDAERRRSAMTMTYIVTEKKPKKAKKRTRSSR